jgi:hypothetical protein
MVTERCFEDQNGIFETLRTYFYFIKKNDTIRTIYVIYSKINKIYLRFKMIVKLSLSLKFYPTLYSLAPPIVQMDIVT